MTRLLLTLTVMAGLLAPAWGQDTVRINNATKAVISPIPFRVGQSAVDPTTPGNGSIWYDTATNKLEARINGVTVELGAANIITGADTQVMFFNGANTPAGDPGMTYNPTLNSLSLAGGLSLSGSGTFNGNTSFDGNVDMTPEGGVITIAPHTGGSGTINNVVIGDATPLAGSFTALVGTTVNGNTITTGTGTLTLQAGITLNSGTVGGTFGTAAFTAATNYVTPTTLNNSTLPVAATTLSASGASTLTAGTASTTTGTGTLVVTGGVGVSGQVTSGALVTTGSGFNIAGGVMALISGANMQFYNGALLGWSSTAAATGTGDLFLGRESAATLQLGADAATGVNQKLKAMDASAGTGGNLTLSAGNGSTAGGTVNFQTSITTTPVDVGKFDNSATAGHTRFFLYDVDNATLERVTVGAADSGGAGFKVLRIPN